MYLRSDSCVFRSDFRLFFALCRLFRGGVGYLPYPRGENGTQGRQWFFIPLLGGECDSVEVVEAEQISLVRQRLFGFLLWNRRGKKVEAPPTFAPHFSHSAGEEKIQVPQQLSKFSPTAPTFFSTPHPRLLVPGPFAARSSGERCRPDPASWCSCFRPAG